MSLLVIRRDQLEKIMDHARRSYPVEACGILLGRRSGNKMIVEEVRPVRNILDSTSEYLMDPEEQARIFEEAERRGLDVLGFYHSHPFWDPRPSRIDELRSKLWEGYCFLILSPRSSSFRCYLRARDGFVEEEIQLA